MTLEEAIKNAEALAEENQRVVDTHIVFDDVTIDMLYCDDTEVIEEHLANYQMCAEEHQQLAKWLKDYKRLLEQESILDKIKAEIEQYQSDYDIHGTEYDRTAWKSFNRCLQIIDKCRAEADCHSCKTEHDCYDCEKYTKNEDNE